MDEAELAQAEAAAIPFPGVIAVERLCEHSSISSPQGVFED
jgi:hypothetical protein